MDMRDKTISPVKLASIGTAGRGPNKPDAKDLAVVRMSQMVGGTSNLGKSVEGGKVVGYVVAGLVFAAIGGIYAYRKNQRKKPMTRLQHLKTQLGLTEADFKDLKANLSKLNLPQLRELNKAAW